MPPGGKEVTMRLRRERYAGRVGPRSAGALGSVTAEASSADHQGVGRSHGARSCRLRLMRSSTAAIGSCVRSTDDRLVLIPTHDANCPWLGPSATLASDAIHRVITERLVVTVRDDERTLSA